MKCMYCQGEMVRSWAPFHIDRKDVHVSFDNVPAWVCTQCGEPYFEETTVNAIQNVVMTVDEQAHKFARAV